MSESTVSTRAAAMATGPDGGFPAQQQQLPGSTTRMDPVPDHGEETWVGRDRLQGLRTLITGGDSGIGRAVAIAFAREGADVALSYLPEEEDDARTTAEWIRKAGRTALLCPGDLQSPTTCAQVVQDAVSGLGGLDVLVNNAGVQMARDRGIEDISDERLDRIFKTNLYALFWMTRAALPHLGRGSSVINVSSIQAFKPSPSLLEEPS